MGETRENHDGPGSHRHVGPQPPHQVNPESSWKNPRENRIGSEADDCRAREGYIGGLDPIHLKSIVLKGSGIHFRFIVEGVRECNSELRYHGAEVQQSAHRSAVAHRFPFP